MEEQLIYLASPFTTKDKILKEDRFIRACDAAAYLMQKGKVVFSPIVHGYPIARMRDLPTTWEYWQVNCKTFVSRCQSVFVLMLPGWNESTGVQTEIEIAEELNIPILYMDPYTYEIIG